MRIRAAKRSTELAPKSFDWSRSSGLLPELLSAGGDARATMWDGRPRPSDCRKRLGKFRSGASRRIKPESIIYSRIQSFQISEKPPTRPKRRLLGNWNIHVPQKVRLARK